MILNYQLNNFCGCIYKNGNVVFDDKKNLLFSPVGNRITIFDLEKYFISSNIPFLTSSKAIFLQPLTVKPEVILLKSPLVPKRVFLWL